MKQDISLPTHKSLFQLQAERLLRLRKLGGNASIPWYIMTSSFTHAPTQEFLERNKYFGLPVEDVVLFQQGTLPCVSLDGHILLDSQTTVQTSSAVVLIDDRLLVPLMVMEVYTVVCC